MYIGPGIDSLWRLRTWIIRGIVGILVTAGICLLTLCNVGI